MMREPRRLSSMMDLDLLLMIILGAFTAAFLVETRTYNPTAALFPRLVSAATLLLILWTVGFRFWKWFRHADLSERDEEGAPEGKGAMRWQISLVTMLGYFVLIYIIGFTWATLVFLVAFPLLLGYRKYKIVIVVGVLWTIAFVFSMNNILQARIPEGWLIEFLKSLMARQ